MYFPIPSRKQNYVVNFFKQSSVLDGNSVFLQDWLANQG